MWWQWDQTILVPQSIDVISYNNCRTSNEWEWTRQINDRIKFSVFLLNMRPTLLKCLSCSWYDGSEVPRLDNEWIYVFFNVFSWQHSVRKIQAQNKWHLLHIKHSHLFWKKICRVSNLNRSVVKRALYLWATVYVIFNGMRKVTNSLIRNLRTPMMRTSWKLKVQKRLNACGLPIHIWSRHYMSEY